jgi:hypothetical protein
MHPALFDQVEKALQTEGPTAAIGRLCQSLRDSRDYHLLFYALLLRKRHELGVLPIPTAPSQDIPTSAHPAYEDGIRNAAREVGKLYLDVGQPTQAYYYFKMIDELGPVREAIEKYQAKEDEELQGVIQLAFYEGLAPTKGFDLLLERYGTCSAITTLSSSELPHSEEVKHHCIKALVRQLYRDLRSSLASAITEKFGAAPSIADAPEGTPGVVRQLIQGRDYLFEEDAYHIDTSHLSSVVQMAMNLPKSHELDLAREMCEYGARLSGRFLGQDDFPFNEGFADYKVYLDIMAGQNVEQGITHFRQKLENADPDDIGTYPAEVLVNLLLKLGRGPEALAISRKYLAATESRPMSCPNLNELCQRLGDYKTLAETAKEQGDPVHYLAGLIAARK